jgi:hypothetical protein
MPCRLTAMTMHRGCIGWLGASGRQMLQHTYVDKSERQITWIIHLHHQHGYVDIELRCQNAVSFDRNDNAWRLHWLVGSMTLSKWL